MVEDVQGTPAVPGHPGRDLVLVQVDERIARGERFLDVPAPSDDGDHGPPAPAESRCPAVAGSRTPRSIARRVQFGVHLVVLGNRPDVTDPALLHSGAHARCPCPQPSPGAAHDPNDRNDLPATLHDGHGIEVTARLSGALRPTQHQTPAYGLFPAPAARRGGTTGADRHRPPVQDPR